MGIFDISLSLTGAAIPLGLIVLFVRRKLIRQFPFFFAYLLNAVMAPVLPIAVGNRPLVYFWMYWSTEILQDLVTFMTVREIFRRLFPPDVPTFRRFGWLLPATGVLLKGVSLCEHSMARFTGAHPPWFVRAIYCFPCENI